MTTPERRASWGARMREFCADREKLRKRGRNLKAINARIEALQKDLDKLEGEGGD